MKNPITRYILAFLLGMVVMFSLRNCGGVDDGDVVDVPVVLDVEVPTVSNDFEQIKNPEPIYIPYEVVVTDSILIQEYKIANDSLKKKLFESAVTKRNYEETFDDYIQTITVKAEVTGTLNSLKTSYKTKSRTIRVDTIVKYQVPDNDRAITLYGEVGVPTSLSPNLETAINNVVVFKAGLDFTTKKNWTYGLSYDTKKGIWLKVGKRFDF